MTRLRQAVDTRLWQVENVQVTPLLLLQALLILVAGVVFSRLLTRFLRGRVFNRAGIGVGIQESISRVLHYLVVLIAFFVALEHLGINLTALAAVGAVLMVGIGFGLQNIANNFISGLILLFERPIQVGDFVEVKGALGTVASIRARSTTVNTNDNVSIIVPNSHFVSEMVTNWSFQDKRTRIHVRVHVAYGSEVDQVAQALLGVATTHPQVLKNPAPEVQFYEFGESALKFDLLAWIGDPPRQFFIRSDLTFAISKSFREKGIRIPFPQRELHFPASGERPETYTDNPPGDSDPTG